MGWKANLFTPHRGPVRDITVSSFKSVNIISSVPKSRGSRVNVESKKSRAKSRESRVKNRE